MRDPLTPARTLVVVALCAGGSALALVFALCAGSVAIDAGSVLDALSGRAGVPRETRDIVIALRLPRALCAFAVGGLLALAGALMQVVLRNPLADPYVLGLSGGAAVGALLAILAGAAAMIGPAAFAGALLSTSIVFTLAGQREAVQSTRLLLTGVVVAAGWSAFIALLLSLAPSAQVKGMLFWLLGDLGGAADPRPALAALLLAFVLAWALARSLNRLARGADHAAALGVDVDRTALATHGIAAFAAAAAVTQAGSVGFVGLIVPHALRLVLGNDQRLLLPAAVFAGGALVVVADTLARTVFAPQQVPVGVITALIGVPTFLWLQRRAP
ncbi:MAG: iron ABC transporter permease [Betaproteobacteria bacterium]